MRSLRVVALIFCLATPLLAAEEERISVKAEVDKALITIGERVEYRITITHDPAVEVISKVLPPPSDVFEVKEVHDFSEKQGKLVVEGRRFVLTTYELGEFILDPVSIRYRTRSGEEKTIETNRLYVTVQSVEPSGKPKTDIRGVKGVLGLPRNWGWLGGILAFLISGMGLVYWLRKRKKLKGGEAEEPLLSPEEEALLELSRLFDSDLLRRGKLKEYFLRLSEILKRYFERRFGISAIESTTSEILRDLRAKEVPPSLREKIQQILEAADLVKFAKWVPTPIEIIRLNQVSKATVEEARPKTPVPEESTSSTPYGV